MKIIINAASIFKGGAEQVVHSFINECRNIGQHEYYIFLCDNIIKLFKTETFGSNFHFYRINKRPATSIINLLKILRYFNKLEKKIQPDVVISTGGHGFWIPNVPFITGFNIPHYIYPESPYFKKISVKRKLYWELKKKFDLFFYKQADAIITQTDDVNQRVKQLVGDKEVYTVSNTVNGVFLNPSLNGQKLPQKEKDEIRLLTISSNYPHKNLDIIMNVVDELLQAGIKNVKFILTLPDDAFKKFKKSKYRQYIKNIGPVSIEQCPALYRECDIMFLPTLLECFSASYVEAMAMGKPILTSDLPFARTVCKGAAIYFDPMSPFDIAAKIKTLIQSKAIQERLLKKGRKIFIHINTPKERAEKFLSICESHANSKLTEVNILNN